MIYESLGRSRRPLWSWKL